MNRYRGTRGRDGGAVVWKDDQVLSPARSQRVNNHSGDFEWGYGGSGPSQLALALLLEEGLDEESALGLHQDFKWAVIANLEDGWALDSASIAQALARLR